MEDENRMDLQDSEAPHCDFISVHEDIVNRVMQVMPADQQLLDLAEFFRVFGDSTRIRIQSAISHQLRVLKQMRLVKFRRDGKTVFYSLADGHIETILAQGMEHISE